jgi:hypothetical protein
LSAPREESGARVRRDETKSKMSAKKRQIDSSKKKEKPLPVGKPISQTTERRMYAAFEFKGQMVHSRDLSAH